MDPISALGAASAVVGIAGFAIQLCEVLHKVSSEIKGAHDSLVAVVTIIESTVESLKLIHRYLDLESQNQLSGQKGGLFSKDALVFVKNNADRCLLVFWRIEATVLDRSDKNLEAILRQRLAEFDSKARAQPGNLMLNPELVHPSLSFLGRLRWPLVAPKLDEFRSQLQFHQQCLSLVFMVISLGEVRSKPTTSNQDLADMAKMTEEIKAASKEIKSTMKAVHSIRGMVQEGDINVGVLFGEPGAGGKPEKRTNSRRAHDGKDPRDSPESPPRPPVPRQPDTGRKLNLWRQPAPEDPKPAPNPRAPGPIAQAVELSTAAASSVPPPENPRPPVPMADSQPDEAATANDPERLGIYQRPSIAHPGKQVGFHPLPAPTPGLVPMGHNSSPSPPIPDIPSSIPKDPPDSVPTIGATEPQASGDGGEGPTRIMDTDGDGSGGNEEPDDDENEGTSDGDRERRAAKIELAISAFSSYRNGPVSRYIIKRNGAPILLGPAPLGRLERLAEATRWWPSKGAMCRTLASATEEQLEVLAGLLDLPDSHGRSVSRSILRVGKIKQRGGPVYRASSDVWALLAVVEDTTREESSFTPYFTDIGRKEKDPVIVGRVPASGNPKGPPQSDRPEVRFQDLSQLSGSRHDFTRRLTTYHIWKIQPFLDPRISPHTVSARADWTRCFVIEEDADQDEIARRCAHLERSILGGLSSTWSKLTIDQRAQIARLEEQLAFEEQKGPSGRPNFAWYVEYMETVKTANQRGLFEAVRKKKKEQAPEISAILVFFTRRPAHGVDVAQLFHITTSGHGHAPPIYTRVARRHLSIETLRAFNIAFIVDPQDPEHLLIKRPIHEEELDPLWEHTRAIREKRRGSAPINTRPHGSPVLSTQDGDHHGPDASSSTATFVRKDGEAPPPPSRHRRHQQEETARRRMELEHRIQRERDLEAEVRRKREAEEEARRLKQAEEDTRRVKEEAEEDAKHRFDLEQEARRREELAAAIQRQRDLMEDAKRRSDLEKAEKQQGPQEWHVAEGSPYQPIQSMSSRSRMIPRPSEPSSAPIRFSRASNQTTQHDRTTQSTEPLPAGQSIKPRPANQSTEPRHYPDSLPTDLTEAEDGPTAEDDDDSTAEDDDDIVARLLSRWTPAGAGAGSVHASQEAAEGPGQPSRPDQPSGAYIIASNVQERERLDTPTNGKARKLKMDGRSRLFGRP
ncbi:hypothetical protein MAPG_04551 [Magnaporthiopsis poae ATCC 64411]|uniref:Fungal N-terminal domain-containing protein n=1 Tax=Magnaporthiopsis poae (strain ATCC 64411 / 73-15) TaxID=644358 RepID=A0A0C4DX15_MAGP6|nr:hypothetical protein MAPG_04551 [Magnaporthiopsis poae ATCC 64411]